MDLERCFCYQCGKEYKPYNHTDKYLGLITDCCRCPTCAAEYSKLCDYENTEKDFTEELLIPFKWSDVGFYLNLIEESRHYGNDRGRLLLEFAKIGYEVRKKQTEVKC